jgi:FkbM family methyltransferase
MDEFTLYMSTQFMVLESHYGRDQRECQYHLLRPLPIRVLYGFNDWNVDVTDMALQKCVSGNNLIIPAGEALRDTIFGDPLPKVLKDIKIRSKGEVVIYPVNVEALYTNSEPSLNTTSDTQMSFKSIQVLYGINNSYSDITDLVRELCIHNGLLEIPAGNGACDELFGDPLPNVLKHIKLTYQGVTTIFTADQPIILNEAETGGDTPPEDRLDAIHKRLKFKGGDIRDTYPNQLMVVMFLQPHNKVIELGAGIGRTTLTIASLLNNSASVVAMECNAESYLTLCENRDANGLAFKVENAALSGRATYQKDWHTYPEGVQPPGAMRVPTTDWASLKAKYPMAFDTIVVDCEGALYYILQEYPDLLTNIKLVIVENNYSAADHLSYVDHVLFDNKFKCIFSKAGGWGPCTKRFYEVWAK